MAQKQLQVYKKWFGQAQIIFLTSDVCIYTIHMYKVHYTNQLQGDTKKTE